MENKVNYTANDLLIGTLSTIPVVGIFVLLAYRNKSDFVKRYAKHGGIFFVFYCLLALFLIPTVLFDLLELTALVVVTSLLIICLFLIVVILNIVVFINALQGDEDYEMYLIYDWASAIFKD